MRGVGIALVAVGLVACSGSERRQVSQPNAAPPATFDAAPAAAPADAAPLDAGAADAQPPPVATIQPTPETSCTTDADCHIFNNACGGFCGTCPTGGEAVNDVGLTRLDKQCTKDLREWEKSPEAHQRHRQVYCGRCSGGSAKAVCKQGVCIKIVTRDPTDDIDPEGD